MLLDPAFLQKLNRISLVARRPRAGQATGERRSTKRGVSVEFADYRDYAKGDDLRRVDWNIYARLERPFVKLFEEEEDLAVYVLLDGSGSMDWGEEVTTGDSGETNKWLYARRLAAALGYVALAAGDRLTVAALVRSPDGAVALGPLRGQGNALRLFSWLEGLTASGTTDLNASLRRYALAGGRPGLVVLLSDLFSPPGYADGLTALAARGHEVAVVHLLAPDEVEPPLGGDLRLVDVETGETQEVTIDRWVQALYRRRVAAWQDEIRAVCRSRGAVYVPVETATPVERTVLYDLRRVGLLK